MIFCWFSRHSFSLSSVSVSLCSRMETVCKTKWKLLLSCSQRHTAHCTLSAQQNAKFTGIFQGISRLELQCQHFSRAEPHMTSEGSSRRWWAQSSPADNTKHPFQHWRFQTGLCISFPGQVHEADTGEPPDTLLLMRHTDFKQFCSVMALNLPLCFQLFPPLPGHRGSAVIKKFKTCWTSTTTGKKTFPA